tara:strand:- start:220 stop:1053 length:834 start_codon:yes stop_codon:yes gene_type:complete
MKKIESIKYIINKYDNFIIDQWGVMHDGTNGYKHAINTISYLNDNNKKLFIISNSSKREKSSEARLPLLGFEKKSFKKILTSGEMIWNTLKKQYINTKNKKCLHIYDKTKDDGLKFREGLNFEFTDDICQAELILACTPYANMEPIEYIPMLNKAIEKKLVMYCANPDFETIEKKNNKNLFCMGVISEIYKKMGGEVIIQGKPELNIYKEIYKNTKLDKSRTIAVGDSLFHDIKGANNFKIDSILIVSGVHKELKNIKKIINNHKILPTFYMDIFNI